MEPSDFKMEDFMDVVYKCKFCPYSCTQSPDMGLHVKEKHLKQPSFSLPEKNTGVSLSVSADNFLSLCNVGNSTHLTITEEGILSAEGGDKGSMNIQVADDVLPRLTQVEGQAYHMDKSLPRAIPVSQSSSSMTLSNGSNPDLTELISMVKDNNKAAMLDNQTHSLTLEPVVQMSGPVPGSSYPSSSSLLHPGLNHPASSSQSMAVMAIQLPQMNTDNTSSQYIVQQNGDNQVALAMNDTTETKEYLLCGLCKLAFTSMEDCQSHMQTEHRELMHGAGVSIGVQVGGGKRGRKRKSEVQSTQAEVTIKEEPELDPDDLEWLPSVPEGNQTTHRDGRMRRKVIPPKALKEDYVLGRRVVKKRKKNNNSYLGYNIMCPMMSCKARFKTKPSMEIHLSSHNLDDASFTCPQCQASHDFWKDLRIHLWKVHKVDVDLLTCDSCAYKTDTYHKMTVHKEIHTDDKPYKCTICNKGFRQAAQQKNHMTIHRTSGIKSESNRWFSSKTCDICERTFANSKCLAKHKEAVHAKIKPFQCSFCGHTTARKGMMELHVRTHTGEKPFKCDVCPYTTGDHNSLRRHKMRHTGETQYHCSLCPYTCIQSISLKQHIKNKHPGANSGIFHCSRCPFRSINQSHYDSHMLDHKKGLIPDIAVTLKVNETKSKKLPQKQSAGNAKQRGGAIQNGVESLFQKHPQFHTIIPGEGTTQSSLEALSVGPALGEVQTEVFNMQVVMLAGGDTQVSAEDMARLSESPNLMAVGISPLQLIYATLSTISEQADLSCVEEGRSSLLTIELVGGIQTSVLSSVQDSAITHSITYHFPVVIAAATGMAAPPPPTIPPSSLTVLGEKSSNPVEEEGGVTATMTMTSKLQSVINSEDLEQPLPSSSSSLSSSTSSLLTSTLSSLSSSLLPQPLSAPPPMSSMVLPPHLVVSGKDNTKVVGLDGGGGGGGGSDGLTSCSSSYHLTDPPPLLAPAGYNISLLGGTTTSTTSTSISGVVRTNDAVTDAIMEVKEEVDSQSVFLIQDGELVEKTSSSNGTQQQQQQQQHHHLVDSGDNNNSSSLVLLDGKAMEITGLDRGGSSSIGTIGPIPPGKPNKIGSHDDSGMANVSLGSLTTLINTDHSQLAMINATASDIMQLIPISFLDQNGQELSTAQTFIPSSNCG